jgi:hypothetical protein
MKRQIPFKRTILLALLMLAPILVLSVKTIGQEDKGTSPTGEQWEYLAIANASRTNFSPTGNPNMRKAPRGAFGTEAFVLETQMDKLGAEGWELVSVTGAPNDPIFYFKRRK